MIAVLTGGSRGIGRATALALAARGVDLALLGRPSAAQEETLEQLRALGVRAEAFACNLEHSSQIAAAVERVLATFGAPQVLINCAGIVERGRVEETSVESWDRQLRVNLRAPFLLSRAFLPAMKRERQGRIIQVGSISATIGSPGAAAYAASKWGLVGFMKSLAAELSDTGVQTLAILPGSVDTDMLKGSGFPPRMTAEDVASTIVHFALDAPGSHNGGVVEMFGT